MTDLLPATREGIATAAAVLGRGGLVAFPTDTVYGVACAAGHPERVAALYELKRRPAERRIPMLVDGLDGVPSRWRADERAQALAARFWPGALTLVLAGEGDPETQAFRAPDHPVALALIAAAGPLLATSANVSDEPDTLGADEVLIAFATSQDRLDAVVDGGAVPGGRASTVLDLSVRPARILRPGPVAAELLAEVVEIEETAPRA